MRPPISVPGGALQPSTPALLSEERFDYDDRNRRTRARVRLFVSAHPDASRAEEPLYVDGDGNGWAQTVTEYDRESRVVGVTNDNGHRTQLLYDGLGRAVKVIDPAGNALISTYDDSGNVMSLESQEIDATTSLVEVFVAETVYDAASRAIRTVNNAGGVATVQYDARGLVVARVDEEGNAVKSYHDVLGRSRKTEWVLTASGKGPGGGAIGTPDTSQGGGDGLIHEDIVHDLNGRIRFRVDDNGNQTEFQYSNRNLLVREIHADGTFATYTHDDDGNVIERRDPNGTVVVQGFDALSRLLTISAQLPQGNPWNVVGTGSQAFAYDGVSRMVVVLDEDFWTNDASRVEYLYDSPGRLLLDRQVFSGSVGFAVDVLSETDGAGNTTRVTYPSGITLARKFDALERLLQISEPGGGAVVEYKYVGPARVRQRESANGINLDVGYDSLRRPTSWQHGTVARFDYGYDAVGNRTFDARDHDPEHGRRYAYDSAYRLWASEEGEVDAQGALLSQNGSESFTLDGVGNRSSYEQNGNVHTYSVNNLNQYTDVNGRTLAYDANGNLIADGDRAYRYDFLNRLREILVSGSTIAEYKYDGRGRRVVSDGPGGVRQLVHHESHVIEERDATGERIASYVYGRQIDELIEKRPGSERQFFHSDGLGSVAAVTDAGGSVLERYRYESYGKPTFLDGALQDVGSTQIENRHLFTGREWDDTGLYYYRARYYSPELGRFLNRDPAGYVDGLNLYAYVLNNPINRADPTGLLWVPQWVADAGNAVQNFGASAAGMVYGLGQTAAGVAAGTAQLAAAGVAQQVVPGNSFSQATFVETGQAIVDTPARMAEAGARFDAAAKAGDHFEAARAAGNFTGEVTVVVAAGAGAVKGAAGLRGRGGAAKGPPAPKGSGAPAEGAVANRPASSANPATHAASGDAVTTVKVRELRYSQRSAGGRGGARADPLRKSMAEKGYDGEPIDVVMTKDGPVTIDNTRPAVAAELGIEVVPARVHQPGDLLPDSMKGRFGDAKTWGEALKYRTGRQSPPLGDTGTSEPPSVPSSEGTK